MAGLVFTLWMAGAGRARGALAFAEYTYHVGLETSGVAAADVNGDGSLDLICANYSNNTLTVLTNNGSGVFVTNGTYHVGKGPTYVTAADLRGSGMVDLVCANYGGGGGTTLSILTNNGSGVFGSNATVTVGLGPSCVLAADLRGTGHLDLVSANSGTNGNGQTLSVLTNNGSGIFHLANTLTVGTDPVNVVAADVNGDGRLDLICANDLGGSVTVLTNKGSAQFVTSTTISDSGDPVWLAATDVNGDGKVDLVVADIQAGDLRVMTNAGNGSFATDAILVLPTSLGVSFIGPSIPISVCVADVNGDGYPDLICAAYYGVPDLGAVLVYTNSAAYRFTTNRLAWVDVQPSCLIAADVNGDGKPDFICPDGSTNTLAVLINTNSFSAATTSPKLTLTRQTNWAVASWPSSSPGWSLQEKSSLGQARWLPSGYAGFPVSNCGTNMSLAQPYTAGSRFYHLAHP